MAKVASVGIHIVDVLGRPVNQIPEGQNLAILDEIRITVAGTAAGASVDLAKLGAEVYTMGALGDDELANFVENTMQRYGINTEGLVRKNSAQTSATMLPIRPNGERPALHVPGTSEELSIDDIDLDRISEMDYLHIGGTPLMPKLDGKPMAKIFEHAKKHGVTTTYDLLAMPKPDLLENVCTCLPFVDYFMPGFEEAVMMTGIKNRSDLIKYFLDKGAKHTVFKMGHNGSSIAWSENGSVKELRIPSFKVPVVDSTGCGDAYCAGFIVGLSRGWDIERAGRLGSAAGALCIQGLGSDAGVVNLKKTIQFMDSAEELPIV
jgi:sugar/nucleoside kinase (ribokinase family)